MSTRFSYDEFLWHFLVDSLNYNKEIKVDGPNIFYEGCGKINVHFLSLSTHFQMKGVSMIIAQNFEFFRLILPFFLPVFLSLQLPLWTCFFHFCFLSRLFSFTSAFPFSFHFCLLFFLSLLPSLHPFTCVFIFLHLPRWCYPTSPSLTIYGYYHCQNMSFSFIYFQNWFERKAIC